MDGLTANGKRTYESSLNVFDRHFCRSGPGPRIDRIGKVDDGHTPVAAEAGA